MNGDQNQQPTPQEPKSEWEYKTDNKPSDNPEVSPAFPPEAQMNSPQSGPSEVSWTASEYVAHQKSFGWYAMLTLAAITLAAVVYLLTSDVVTAGIIVVVSLIFGFAAGRKPRVLPYRVDERGLSIDKKYFPYSEFKSFSIIQEGAFSSIMFLPLKRFMPPITIYYEPADEDQIAFVLAQHLPMEDRKHDAIDRLVSRIRF